MKKTFWFGIAFSLLAGLCVGADSVEPPPIRSLLKPSVFNKVVNEREVMVYASLQDGQSEQSPKRYSFYAAMLVRSSFEQTRRVMTDYPFYAKMIPYVDQAQYLPESKTVRLSGGIFKYRLESTVQILEKSLRWIGFEVVSGHFTGLKGNFYLENRGEEGTLVYFHGEIMGKEWPPRFVIERGAEIVFGFTGQKMRSYIESQKNEKGKNDDSKIPKPRSRI